MTIQWAGLPGSGDLLGVGLAAVAAVLIATRAICSRRGSQQGHAVNVLMIVPLVNAILLTPGAVVAYFPAYSLTPAALNH